MNNVWKTIGGVATVALLLTVSVLSVAAAPNVPNDSPAGANYIDNAQHTVAVSKSAWYRFDYQTNLRASDRTPIYLTLVNGNDSGVEMSIYTFDQVNDDLADSTENWRAENPVGRGTAARYNCSNHIPRANGDCVSNDLTWVGTFANSGSYYVRIRNTNLAPSNFTLKVEGANVSLLPTMNAQNAMHAQ
jgi:hypothetical protein